MAARKKKISDVVTIDDIAKDFKVDSVGDYDEKVLHSGGGSYDFVYKQALEAGKTEEQAEEAAREAEDEERDEAVGKYMDAVMFVADRLYGEHGLTLVPKHKGKHQSYDFKVVPEKSWEDAADRIRQTINGVGYFEFNNLRDFLTSGPYTPREAVMEHLHWIASWPEVYGEGKPGSMVERRMR